MFRHNQVDICAIKMGYVFANTILNFVYFPEIIKLLKFKPFETQFGMKTNCGWAILALIVVVDCSTVDDPLFVSSIGAMKV